MEYYFLMSSEILVVIMHILSSTTALIQVEVEPVGRWFHVYEARRLRGHLTSSAGESEEESEEEEAQEVEVEDDIHYLRSLNPADWKVRQAKQMMAALITHLRSCHCKD